VVVHLRTKCFDHISELLERDFSGIRVIVTPDFFLDRILTLKATNTVISNKIDKIIKTKGGSIDNINQIDQRGGNAVNTASALAALGISVTPIVCTNMFGARLINYYLDAKRCDLSHVKILEGASRTTALEFPGNGEERVNVMLRDTGSLANFGPRHFSQEDFRVIEEADYVCVFNWAGTRRFGTRLAETVFRRVKENGKGKTYLDTADPRPNVSAIPELISRVFKQDFLDILSVNENEAVTYASHTGRMKRELKKGLHFEDLAKQAAAFLGRRLRARIDLHTSRFSASFRGDKCTSVPSFQVPVLRATGSGDAWNAGNIVGDAFQLSDECRLTLASLIAAYYISEPSGKHPSKKQLLAFCEKLKENK
jgi:sugar/nucleoside kinase (ribokinase family)